MSNKTKGFTVALDADYKNESLDDIQRAIEMVKGVLSVTRLETSSDDWVNRQMVRLEMRGRLISFLDDDANG